MDFDCAFCQPTEQQGAIKEGEQFLWITGHRTYERMTRENGMLLYIPWEIKKAKKLFDMDPKDFRDPLLKHRACANCAVHLTKFFQSRGSVKDLLALPPKHILSIRDRFTMRYYDSNLNYNCRMCGSPINPGMSYVRFGIHRNCYCPGCISKVEGIIGTEYSYYE